MRVGLLCPYSLSVPGGVQGQVLGLARALRARGHEARVLSPCDGPPPEPFVTPLGNSLPTAANGSMAPLAPDPSAALRTMRALRDEDFDVLHLHEPLAPGPTLTAVVLHDTPLVGTFHMAGDSATYRTLRPMVRWAAGHLDARCAVSRAAADLAHRYLGGEYLILFNGVEIDRWQRVPPAPKSGPTVFFCSRHEPRKGLEVLLEAMTHLPAEVRCWVASTGPDTARLRTQYAGDPRIEWLGRLSEQDKVARMRAADVFCAPSLGGESFGVVLIEAMAAGTPVVASNLDGYRNVADHGRDALLTEVGDPVALAGGIAEVLSSSSTAAQLIAGGAVTAASFSMDALAARYEERYEWVRRRGPGGLVAPGRSGSRTRWWKRG
ncbi:MAG: glycosyltransferase family 4 protein [Acidimicrobiales bacterium]